MIFEQPLTILKPNLNCSDGTSYVHMLVYMVCAFVRLGVVICVVYVCVCVCVCESV